MVNSVERSPVRRTERVWVDRLVGAYVVVVVVTVGVLALLAANHSRQATTEAWVHAAVVAAFAFLLPARLLAAHRGRPGAWRAVAIISAVLVVANVVEGVLPGLFPVWMRWENLGIAVLMAAVVLLVVRIRR